MSKKRGMSAGKIAALILAATALIFMVSRCVSCAESAFGSVSAEEAARFVREQGVKVDEGSARQREITIPPEFSDVYLRYNEIQKEQGFDLEYYRGETVTQYVFDVPDYKDENGNTRSGAQVHVLTKGGKIIGADICCADMGGMMEGIVD